MMKLTENNDRCSVATATLEDMNIFIIPNSPNPIQRMTDSKWSTTRSKRMARSMKEMFELNKWGEMPSDEKAVEIWWVAENCGNVYDHHPTVMYEGKKYELKLDCPFLPMSIIKDWKEGESHVINIPVSLYEWETDAKTETVFKATIVPSQTKYRYRRFGTFQECISVI